MLLLVPLYRLVERERENTVSIKTTRCSLILTKRVEREEDDRLGTGEGRGMMDWRGVGGGGMDTHILTREVLMVGGMGNRCCTMPTESPE